jgi:glycosyltransferase involved in cell wall biosynthesis
MHVSILPDPDLFQRPGGVQAQVRETMDALVRRGVRVSIAAPGDPLSDRCDVLHVFGSVRGAGYLVEAAAAMRIPVVLSPRVSPAWNSANGTRARVADRVLGNMTSWDFDTGYAQIRRALQGAHMVLALGESERKAICTAFLIDAARVRVIPNGIAGRFFDADPRLFRERLRIAGGFALVVGQVSAWNDQGGIARVLAGLALPLVVVGEARERDAIYERELRTLRTVTCLGPLEHDDPLLASAYAAASVLIIPGQRAALPAAALEALAAGTPVVAPCGGPGLGGCGALRVVAPQDGPALAQEVSDLMARPPQREQVREAVRAFTWDAVAARLVECYRELERPALA